jgi:hypothetical protein
MKTNELTGAALDWAVASYADKHVTLGDIHWGNYAPSTNWAQGGPIIERERIQLRTAIEGNGWSANAWYKNTTYFEDGATPLIAAMRCYVASKMGDEVEIPKELTC